MIHSFFPLVCLTLSPSYATLFNKILCYIGASSHITRYLAVIQRYYLSFHDASPSWHTIFRHFTCAQLTPHKLFLVSLHLPRYTVHSNVRPFIISAISILGFRLHGSLLVKKDAHYRGIKDAFSWPDDARQPPLNFVPTSF